MNLSDYAVEQLLNAITGNGVVTFPSTLSLALLKTASAPSDTIDTNPEKEILDPGTDGYDRQLVEFAAAVGGVALSDIAATFGPATDDWPAATHGWLIDDADNIWFHGPLTVAKTVGDTDELEVLAGSASLSLA
jgi:hypothetical protein